MLADFSRHTSDPFQLNAALSQLVDVYAATGDQARAEQLMKELIDRNKGDERLIARLEQLRKGGKGAAAPRRQRRAGNDGGSDPPGRSPGGRGFRGAQCSSKPSRAAPAQARRRGVRRGDAALYRAGADRCGPLLELRADAEGHAPSRKRACSERRGIRRRSSVCSISISARATSAARPNWPLSSSRFIASGRIRSTPSASPSCDRDSRNWRAITAEELPVAPRRRPRRCGRAATAAVEGVGRSRDDREAATRCERRLGSCRRRGIRNPDRDCRAGASSRFGSSCRAAARSAVKQFRRTAAGGGSAAGEEVDLSDEWEAMVQEVAEPRRGAQALRKRPRQLPNPCSEAAEEEERIEIEVPVEKPRRSRLRLRFRQPS